MENIPLFIFCGDHLSLQKITSGPSHFHFLKAFFYNTLEKNLAGPLSSNFSQENVLNMAYQ